MQVGEKHWFASAPWVRDVLRGEVLMIEGEQVLIRVVEAEADGEIGTLALLHTSQLATAEQVVELRARSLRDRIVARLPALPLDALEKIAEVIEGER